MFDCEPTDEETRHAAHMQDLQRRRANIDDKLARSLADYYAKHVSGSYQQAYVVHLTLHGPIMSGEIGDYETVWLCSDGKERTAYEIRDEMVNQIRQYCPEITDRMDVFVLADEALELFKGITG